MATHNNVTIAMFGHHLSCPPSSSRVDVFTSHRLALDSITITLKDLPHFPRLFSVRQIGARFGALDTHTERDIQETMVSSSSLNANSILTS